MKNNKSKKIFIIAIIVIVLILVVGVTYAFLATDMFKSDKDMFFKYASQILDDENGLIDNKLIQYNEKKRNSAYEHEGTLTFNVDSENISTTSQNNLNDFNISFAGNFDNTNEQAEELIKINYSKNAIFPILYKKSNGVHAIKLNDISKKYFAVKEDEIQDLISKFDAPVNFNIDTNSIPNIAFTADEKNHLQETYLPVIENNLDKANFSKVSTINGEGYSLKIDNQKFTEILTKLLETLKNDESTIDKLSDAVGSVLTSYDIDTLIDNINENEVGEGSSIITVYQSKNILNKIEVQFNDEIKISISKTSNENDVSYSIDIESTSFSANLTLTYSGLQTLEQIQEEYALSLNDGQTGESYQYNIQNNVNFTNNIEIEELSKDEYIDLNTLDRERLSKLFEMIANGIQKVNAKKMEEAKIVGDNPIITAIPGLSQGLTIYNSSNNIMEDNQEENKEETTQTNNVEEDNSDTNSSSSLVQNMENVSKETFNQRFKQYEGDNVRGSTVKSLLLQIIANNMLDKEDGGRPIEVTGDVKLTGTEVPDSVEASKNYKVKCSTDSEGYISKVEIKENK